jgi:hypothetical protein
LPVARQLALRWGSLAHMDCYAGIILEYERRDGSRNTKIIDLLTLSAEYVYEMLLITQSFLCSLGCRRDGPPVSSIVMLQHEC